MTIEIYLEDEKNNIFVRKMYSSLNPDVDAIKTFIEQFKKELTTVYTTTNSNKNNAEGFNNKRERE